jgi:hypothetical protein
MINRLINCAIVWYSMAMKITLPTNIISINDLRRNFGEVEKVLPSVGYFIVTKKGKPFAVLSATPESKKELMEKTAGALKDTSLDNDSLWEEILTKKSRKKDIAL